MMCFDFAKHGRKKVPKETFFSLKVRKPRYTPPVFWNLLRKFNLIRAQSARKRHAKGVPFIFPPNPAFGREGRPAAAGRVKFPVKVGACT